MVCGRRSEHGRNGASGHDQLQSAVRGVGVERPSTDVHHTRRSPGPFHEANGDVAGSTGGDPGLTFGGRPAGRQGLEPPAVGNEGRQDLGHYVQGQPFAVVEEDHRAVVALVGQVGQHDRYPWVPPLLGVRRPTDMDHPQALGHGIHDLVPVAVGSPEAARAEASQILDQARCAVQVRGHGPRMHVGHPPVVPGVVADRVSATQKVLDLLLPPAGFQVASQGEERGMGPVPVQEVQEKRCQHLVGSVVEREVDDPRILADGFREAGVRERSHTCC